MKQLIFNIYCLIFISCHGVQKVTHIDNQITISETECGSYEIKNTNRLLGYATQPFYIMFPNKMEDLKKEILPFEHLVSATYSGYYDNFYRVYHFTENRANDTILVVTMLTQKQSESIVNWKCRYQDVDTYKRLSKASIKYPGTFYFNCTKKRLKVVGDPD